VGEGRGREGGELSIEFRVGDLFAADLPAIGHGCNCAGAMGRGIAVEFRRRWPEMFAEYKRRCAAGSFTLGEAFAWDAGDRVIFNLGTQQTWRAKAELWAVDAAVRKMIAWAESHAVPAIGLPRIGAGLGGLDWAVVARALEAASAGSGVRLVVFELPSSAAPHST
jgi:O-acetyl-ADP-ribose deacetylase (regulator of RNase III)